jgi:TRAP-type C4-dicarboxylate transport system substrate-binding protein
MPRALKDGICDIAWVGGSNHPAEIPLWTIFTYFLYNPKGDDAAWLVRKGWEFFDNCEPMRKDFERLGQTAWFFIPYDSFALYSKKAVKGLDDMKGMRIRIVGEGYMKMLNAIGVHPQFIPASDLYPAMERGTVDGAITGWEMGKRYRFYEVVPYITDTAITFALSSNNVALAAVKKMSEKDRKIFFDIGRRMSIEYGDSEKNERANYKAFMQEKGLKILPFPAQDREKWANMPEVKGLVKSWVETQNRAGRPGTEVMKTFVKIFEMPAWMVEGL